MADLFTWRGSVNSCKTCGYPMSDGKCCNKSCPTRNPDAATEEEMSSLGPTTRPAPPIIGAVAALRGETHADPHWPDDGTCVSCSCGLEPTFLCCPYCGIKRAIPKELAAYLRIEEIGSLRPPRNPTGTRLNDHISPEQPIQPEPKPRPSGTDMPAMQLPPPIGLSTPRRPLVGPPIPRDERTEFRPRPRPGVPASSSKFAIVVEEIGPPPVDSRRNK